MSLSKKHARCNIAPNCIRTRITVDCHVERIVFCIAKTINLLGCLNIQINASRFDVFKHRPLYSKAGPRCISRRSRAMLY